jgi:hypothetical protein
MGLVFRKDSPKFVGDVYDQVRLCPELMCWHLAECGTFTFRLGAELLEVR